jgi:antirestriction protein ArdC
MISTISSGVNFQIRAGLSGYIADLGACFLSADLGIVPELEPRADHASYLASWLDVLANDKRFIFSAAAQAQRAVAYLHGLQPKAAEIGEAA